MSETSETSAAPPFPEPTTPTVTFMNVDRTKSLETQLALMSAEVVNLQQLLRAVVPAVEFWRDTRDYEAGSRVLAKVKEAMSDRDLSLGGAQ